jgi:hypothetical protein
MSLEASDDSEESDLDFDHFAVILKVTNVPYGQPVKQADIMDLVWQNGDHQAVRGRRGAGRSGAGRGPAAWGGAGAMLAPWQSLLRITSERSTSLTSPPPQSLPRPNNPQDGVDTSDLVTDAIWYQVRRDLAADGSETALNGPVKTAADSDTPGTYLTLAQFAQQQTYTSSVPNGKGGLIGVRSNKLTPDTRVLGVAVAILPARPFTYPNTDENEDGIPDWQLSSSRSYSVNTLSITFATPFPSRGGAAPGSGPTTYSVQFGAPESAG